jgi:hypothetical protein
MMKRLGIAKLDRVILAGAFGSYKPDGCPSRLKGLYLFSGMDKYQK